MSAETALSAVRLTRMLRLEDVLINASAVPLPLALMPSAIAQEQPDADQGSADHEAVAAADAANPDVQAKGAETSHAELSGPDGVTAGTEDFPQDAVLNGLQATADAIRQSLEQAPDHSATDDGGTAAQEDGAATAQVAVPVTHGSASLLNLGEGGEVGALSAPHVPEAPVILPQPSAPAITFDAAAFAAQPAMVEISHASQPEAPGQLEATAEATNVTSDVDTVTTTPAAAVETVVHDAAATVTAVTEPAAALVASILDLPPPAAAAAVTQLADGAQDIAQPVAAVVEAVAPVTTVVETAAAVTVPSLQGAGFDALAGLLQPASSASDISLAHEAVHTAVDDIAIFAAIGAFDIMDADATAQMHHAPLPLAGSGLI